MSTYEERAQAIMATLRENDVTRAGHRLDDNSLHGLAMQVMFADAVARQEVKNPVTRWTAEVFTQQRRVRWELYDTRRGMLAASGRSWNVFTANVRIALAVSFLEWAPWLPGGKKH